jgi:putative addiction module CopG family antidote
MSKIDIRAFDGYFGTSTIWNREAAMDQMNISITDQLAGYVRKKVKSGRYNNASEVVREALRRMEDEDERALRLAKPTAEDLLTDFTSEQLDGIRRSVRSSIEGLAAGKFVEYEGREGLKKLAAETKIRGRRLLAEEASGE